MRVRLPPSVLQYDTSPIWACRHGSMARTAKALGCKPSEVKVSSQVRVLVLSQSTLAGVMELADMQGLGPCADESLRAGSTPASGTEYIAVAPPKSRHLPSCWS